jgi:hypothetical protein
LPAYADNNRQRVESERRSSLSQISHIPLPLITKRDSQDTVSKRCSMPKLVIPKTVQEEKEIISAEIIMKN